MRPSHAKLIIALSARTSQGSGIRMPIINRQDAAEVEQYIARFFAAPPSGRAQTLRRLFVEKLDFASATGVVSLAHAPKTVTLPASAERIATMEGMHVVYVPLSGDGPNRVRKAEASVAAKLIANALRGDELLVMTNPSCSQLHVIYPTFVGAAPSLRRMIIERDLPRRTAVQQLSNIFWLWKDTGTIRLAVDKAFDVEAVTKQFFEEYQRVFERALATVMGFGPSKEEKEAKKLFVQTLFNRLMFIYFLSRKGWLKFKGNLDYLNAIRKDYPTWSGEKNFYNNRIKVLFFTGLNNPGSRDVTRGASPLIGEVPFLNGGLFEETPDDKRTNIVVPDTAIDQILHDLFDKFNFTVMESTPFDVEVAVDPEMLGKVFEELVTGRHESGSYYTPRPVVSFMCREALKGYLESQNTGASTEAIAAFVDRKDTAMLTLPSAPKVGEALARVKVVDPACGSGAYLLGMMQELVELMNALYSTQLSHQAQDLYNLKLGIIQQNLYGADIDQFAVNIAMLRLWLSLAIEYDGKVEKLPPLPNLDFKIVCGDSLLGPDPSPANYGTLFRHRVHQLASQLAALKDRHMRATGQEKTNLTKDIEGLKSQLREALAESAAPKGVVDWRVEFAEVFDQNGGFDVAIANPPYVTRTNPVFASSKPRLRLLYPEATTGMSDLYCYFYAQGLRLLRSQGMHVFVCSNTWLDVGFGVKLQEYLLTHAHIRAIYESQVEKQFSTADVNTLISIVQKREAALTDETHFIALRDVFVNAITRAEDRRTVAVTYKELWEVGSDAGDAPPQRKYVGERWGGRFLRAPDIYHTALSKANLVPVSEYARARLGVTTGANEFFFVERVSPGQYSTSVTGERVLIRLTDEFVRPVIRSVSDYENTTVALNATNWFVVTLPKEIRNQLAQEYVTLAESHHIHTRPFFQGRKTWYSLNVLPDDLIAVPELVYTRYFLLWNPHRSVLNKNFYGYQSDVVGHELLWALLNTTFTFLQFELNSRKPGAGASGISVNVANRVVTISPASIGSERRARLINAGQQLLKRPILNYDDDLRSPERRAIDGVIFECMGLSQMEIDSLYESYSGLIEARVAKAREHV